MTTKTENRIRTWIGIVLGICGIFAIALSIQARFTHVEARVDVIEKSHQEHCKELKEREKNFADLGETNIKLAQICIDMDRMFARIDDCQTENREIRREVNNTKNEIQKDFSALQSEIKDLLIKLSTHFSDL